MPTTMPAMVPTGVPPPLEGATATIAGDVDCGVIIPDDVGLVLLVLLRVLLVLLRVLLVLLIVLLVLLAVIRAAVTEIVVAAEASLILK